jgi:predicted TIM-barrel fold metal-dependent hydrolase
MAIIDAHTHLFPPEVIERRDEIAGKDERFSLLYGDPRAKMADSRSLAAYMDSEGIDMAAAFSFPFRDPGLTRLANDYVLECGRGDARILPLAVVDTADGEGAVAEAGRCLEQGARGVGELAYYDTGFGSNERRGLEGVARLLGEAGKPLMLHLNEQVGHHYPGKMSVDFGEVVRFVESHPSLRLILAHMGGGLCFYEFMPEIEKAFSLVYYDLAAVPFLYSSSLYSFAARFLPGKVIFGSDFPLLTLARYKPALEGLEAEAGRRILYENGRRLFGA